MRVIRMQNSQTYLNKPYRAKLPEKNTFYFVYLRNQAYMEHLIRYKENRYGKSI